MTQLDESPPPQQQYAASPPPRAARSPLPPYSLPCPAPPSPLSLEVLELLRKGDEDGRPFDRIVVDTAPTGHTLRLLSFPAFLDDFLENLIAARGQ